MVKALRDMLRKELARRKIRGVDIEALGVVVEEIVYGDGRYFSEITEAQFRKAVGEALKELNP